MSGAAAVLMVCAVAAQAAEFDGTRALAYTRRAVEFGPRPPGSPALAKLRSYIVSELKTFGCQVELDRFTASTPRGPIEMANIIATFPGSNPTSMVISGHYDTKWIPGIHFVGANDGGASTGFLMELARVLAARPRAQTVILVWFDGEEAFGQWSRTDSLYGSRHLAARWAREGMLSRIAALINIDMIGDRDLGIHREHFSTPWLRELVWDVARSLGHSRHFLPEVSATEDDHTPFLEKGVPALNLIDFRYPDERNSYWHTEQDTLDKLSPRSFQVVGEVILETLRRLSRRGE